MSLDNFKLSIGLLPQLYKESLVQLNGKQTNKEKRKESNFNPLGNNQKNILLLVRDTSAIHLNDSDFQFLTGILNACKFNMTDIALQNLSHCEGADFNEITQVFNPEYVILFGVEKESIKVPWSSTVYEVIKNNNIHFLTAPSLRFISENTEEKKKLWTALKKMFNI